MIRKTIRSFVIAGFAAASVIAFSSPTFAATAGDSSAQAEREGWCEIVPTFCSNQCNNTARCNPCPQPVTRGAMDRMGKGCPNVANRE